MGGRGKGEHQCDGRESGVGIRRPLPRECACRCHVCPRGGRRLRRGHWGAGCRQNRICRELAAAGDDRTFSTAILDSGLHADDVLRQLLRDFGLVADHPPDAVAHDTTKLAAATERFLLSLRPLGAHAVVIVDDAERVDQEVLESLQRLMLAGPPDSKLLRLILVGQASIALRLQDRALAGLLALGARVSLDPMETFDHRSSDVWTAAATGTSTEAVLVAPSASSSNRWLAAGVPLLVVGAALVWMMSRGGSGQPTDPPTGAPSSSIQGAPAASGAATPEAGYSSAPAANSPPASAETRPAGPIATTPQVSPTGRPGSPLRRSGHRHAQSKSRGSSASSKSPSPSVRAGSANGFK